MQLGMSVCVWVQPFCHACMATINLMKILVPHNVIGKNEDILKRHICLPINCQTSKTMDPTPKLEFPQESHAGRRKRCQPVCQKEISYGPTSPVLVPPLPRCCF